MGNIVSSPTIEHLESSKPPPIKKQDPPPETGTIDGISVGSSQGCSECILAVPQGISSSSAQIFRNQGMITTEDCNRFNIDISQKVSIETIKINLATGKYYIPNNDGTCTRTFFNPTDIESVTKIEDMPWNKAQKGETRTMTDSQIALSSTKLMIKPTIPFRIYFNGEQTDVKMMTLFHPSPIRIENVQHDAVLTLGDPADKATKLIVMIPLAGSVLPGQTGSFISKIASFIPGAMIANPATGLFEVVDVPTGNDWNLSTMLPGAPRNGETVVNVGYFSWETAPKLESKLKNIVQSPGNLPDVHQYGWKPADNNPTTRYIMLKDPVTINSFDLQTIRMLPITSPSEAIQPPLIDTLVYSPPTTCKDKPYDKSCDPFANIPVKNTVNNDIIWQTIVGFIGTLAGLVALYFAIKYASDNNWGTRFIDILTFKKWRTGKASSPSSVSSNVLAPILPSGNSQGTFNISNIIPNPAAGTGLVPSQPTRQVTPKLKSLKKQSRTTPTSTSTSTKPVTQAQVTAAKKINVALKNELAKRQRAIAANQRLKSKGLGY